MLEKDREIKEDSKRKRKIERPPKDTETQRVRAQNATTEIQGEGKELRVLCATFFCQRTPAF